MNIKRMAFLAFIFFLLSLTGCGENKSPRRPTPTNPPPSTNPPVSERAKEFLNRLGPVEKYYKFAEGFDDNVPIVLLGSQGGPVKDLLWEEHPYFENYHPFFTVAYVHQTQTLRNESDGLDARLIDGSQIISVETARDASLKSAAILHKVADHFKQQGKTVYLISHSFGSFVALHTLAKYGNIFDKILIKAGRINIPVEVFEAFRDECGGEFLDDGVTFQKVSCEDARRGELNTLEKFQAFRSESRLQSALGENRYQTLLRDVPLNNVFYLYGSQDRPVGRLSDSEIRFLRNKGSQVERFNGGHDVQDLAVFSTPPDTRVLLNNDLNAKMYNFLNSPLPFQYRALDMPSQNSMRAYLGSERNALYNIGIVFENHSPQQVSYKLNAAFGDGPFSLFKTNVFKDHKSKFSVQFGRITQTRDSNAFPLSENVKKELQKMLTLTIPRIEYQDDLAFAMADFQNRFPQEDFMPSLYFDILELKYFEDKLEDGETLTTDEQARKVILDRVQSRFTNFFKHSQNQNKNFDVVIYVSSGISGGYANTNADTDIHPSSKVIYAPSGEFQTVWASTMGGHPDLFAVTLVHELGHVFVDLFDEYYAYEINTTQTPTIRDLAQESDNEFSNNCFRKYETQEFASGNISPVTVILDRIFNSIGIDEGIFYYPLGSQDVPTNQILNFSFEVEDVLNPWGHEGKVPFYIELPTPQVIEEDGVISDYDGHLYGGCNGGKSFRGTQNSIMRHYFKYNAQEWPSAWGPINAYYLRRFLDNL